MKFVEDTERHHEDKERRKVADWETLTGTAPSQLPAGATAQGGFVSPRPASTAAGGGRTHQSGGGRDEFFERLRNDLDRRRRCDWLGGGAELNSVSLP